MALQNTGQIGKQDLMTEFSHGSPSPLSDYYRGGAFVPDTQPGTTNSPVPGTKVCNGTAVNGNFFQPNLGYYNFDGCPVGQSKTIACGPHAIPLESCFNKGAQLNLPQIGLLLNNSNNNHCGSVSANIQSTPGTGFPNNFAGYGDCQLLFYQPATVGPTTPGTVNPNVSINNGVPTSGEIQLSDFYGAQDI